MRGRPSGLTSHTRALVKPILAVIDAIFLLRFNIGAVSLGNIFRGSPLKVVNVEVERHGGV